MGTEDSALSYVSFHPALIFLIPVGLFVFFKIISVFQEAANLRHHFSSSSQRQMSERDTVRYWFLVDLRRYMDHLFDLAHMVCMPGDASEFYTYCSKWLQSYHELKIRIDLFALSDSPSLPEDQFEDMLLLASRYKPLAEKECAEIEQAKTDLIREMTLHPRGKRKDLIHHFAVKSKAPHRYKLYTQALCALSESRIVTIANTGEGYSLYVFHPRIAKRQNSPRPYRVDQSSPLHFDAKGITPRSIYKALDTVSDPQDLNASLGTARFDSLLSDRSYYASLSHCTCPARECNRAVPCKHMIRLAIELKVYIP